MSKIMYKTNTFDGIEKVEIERDTEKTVWIKLQHITKTTQFRKKSDSWNFFDTFEEAKQFLIEKHEKTISSLENRINYERERIHKILTLKEDE